MSENVKPSEWTYRHVNEATAELLRLVADCAATGDPRSALTRVAHAAFHPATTANVGSFRKALVRLFNARYVDFDRIIRTVRARADGREVVEVETFYRVKLVDGRYERNRAPGQACVGCDDAQRFEHRADADANATHWPRSFVARVVRVTLTHRRIVRVAKEG